MKLFISADMEGVAGVVTREQLGPEGFEYQQAREWMTGEVSAAVEAARSADVSEVVVADSHGSGQNLLLDRLPDCVRLVRSWPRPLMMMQGVEEDGVSGAMLLGYHSGSTFAEGVLSHTLSGAGISELRVNGKPMSEAGISAATAGHFGVPVIMISGDDAFVKETRSLLGDVEAAVTKWSSGWTSATTMTPGLVRTRIGESVKAALARLDDFEPFRLDGPVELELDLKYRLAAELLDYLPVVERLRSHTVRFVGKDIVEAVMFLAFAIEFRLSPPK
jgi:D-amino peptidase